VIFLKKSFLFFAILFLSLNSFAQTLSLVVVRDYETIAAYKEVVDFVKLAIEDTGIKVKVVEVPRKRGAVSVDSGEYDALPIRGPEDAKSLPNIIISSFPVVFTNFRIVSLKNNKKFSEAKLKTFSGVMALNNSSLQSEVEKRELQVIGLNVGYPELVKMLISGRVDYILMPEEILAGILDQDKTLAKSLNMSSNVFTRTPLYFSMNKKHKDLMPKIEKSLAKALQGDLSRYKYIRNSLNSKLEHK
jgi:ABC-type amino acid transport substrate-binding protein